MQLFTNNADSALDGAIDTAALSITVTSGHGAKFPSPTGGDFFLVTLFQKVGATETNHEIVKCTARTGDVLTLVRAQEGTTAKAFSSADPVELRVTAGTLASKEDGITKSLGYAKWTGTAWSFANESYQAADADLSAIAALTGTAGLLRKTAANTWALDTATYITVGSTETLTNKTINGLNNTLTNISLASSVTGTLPVNRGGTGVATLTGIALGVGTGVMRAAVAGIDYVAPGGVLGTPSSGNLSNCTKDGTVGVGYLGIPQNSKSANYTLVLGDAGKHILHPDTDGTPRTFTIPANASVAFPIGTVITFVNKGGSVVTIAITTDTLRLAGVGTTGSRTMAAGALATLLKVSATEWYIYGEGLS